MALTDAQDSALFDILDIPESTTVNRLTDEDNLLVTQRTVAVSARQAKTLVDAHVAAMTVGKLAVLTDYLDAWIDLGYDMTFIDAGSMGSLAGVTYNPAAEREMIAVKVKGLVPFYRFHEEITRGGEGKNVIPIAR